MIYDTLNTSEQEFDWEGKKMIEKDKIIELIKKISPADQRFLSQLKVIIENHLRKGKH